MTKCTTFAPIILVSRKAFDDDALESRCHVTYMTETTRRDIPLNLPPQFHAEAGNIRNQLLMFRFRNYHRFENDYELRYEGVGSRLNQILQPLGSLAIMVSPEMASEIADIAKECQRRLVADRADSEDGMVIRAYFRLAESGAETTSTNIRDEIAKMGRTDLSVNAIGRRLRSLPFEKGSTGSSKPWKVKECQRDLLILKYLPEDERELLNSAKQQRIDDGTDGQIGQSGQEKTGRALEGSLGHPTLEEKARTIRNLIDKRPTTMAEIEKMLPGHYKVASNLLENGELFKRPDGTLEARP